ncbi:MAG: DUF1801 domain-containing protein [Gammaproteobacteria bacterium]|nr:DUF1801 domain-containing protein [Gammaproteobacteria bacterium]
MNDGRVEQLLSDLCLTNQAGYALVQEVRKEVYSAVPNASECVMYGGFMFAAPAKFCGVFAYTEHVSIEFGRGCDLKDPHRVLEGSGKLRRHIKVQTFADIKSKHLRAYIAQAHENSCGT